MEFQHSSQSPLELMGEGKVLLTFCKIYNFNIEPTEQTLSFLVVYMSSHIKPTSVNSYLSRIANQLEPFSPNVQKSHNSMLVSRTMTGCQHRFGMPVKHNSMDLCVLASSLSQTAWHTAIIVKSSFNTLSISLLSPTHFCCLAIRPTALMSKI